MPTLESLPPKHEGAPRTPETPRAKQPSKEARRQALQERRAEEARVAKEDADIAILIQQEIAGGDIAGKLPLEAGEFGPKQERQPTQTRAVDVTEALNILSDPERAKAIYLRQKAGEIGEVIGDEIDRITSADELARQAQATTAKKYVPKRRSAS